MVDLSIIASWVQFAVLLISIITVGLKAGRIVGTQEQINKNQESTNKRIDGEIDRLDTNVETVECALGEKIDKFNSALSAKIEVVGKDVEFIKGTIK